MRSARLILMLLLLAPVLSTYPASAQVNTFTEDFSTTQYKHASTTAVWDTVAGEIRLPRYLFSPSILGNYDTPSQAKAIAVDGDHVFVADGSTGLLIIDITTPATPALLGTYNTSGNARGVSVDGDFAYVADYTFGLQIIDVTNPASPALAGSYNTSGLARGVAADGDYVFVADGPNGLHVFDVTTPATPSLLGTYDTAGDAHAVAVSGNVVYVADYFSGLAVIDITTPSTPKLIGSYDTGGSAGGIAVDGDYVYLCDAPNNLFIIDVTDPSSPSELGHYPLLHSVRQVSVDGDYAFVADDDSGLVVVDVSDPKYPQLAFEINTPGLAFDVAVDGEYAFLADWGSGMQVIEVAEYISPLNLSEIGNLASYDIDIAGDHAIVTGFELTIYDIGAPTAPVVVGSYSGISNATRSAIAGNIAYVYDDAAGLVVVDISDVTSPTELARDPILGAIGGIDAAGDYVYFGHVTPDSGLIVYDVSNPSVPVRASQYPLPDNARDLVVRGDYLYAAGETVGLLVVDVSDPANPVLTGNYVVPGVASGVAVAGDYAFVAAGIGGLRIIDISDPSYPAGVDEAVMPHYSNNVSVSGNYALVANSVLGLVVVDISDVTSPVRVAESPTSLNIRMAVAAGDYVFSALNPGRIRVDQMYQRGGPDFASNWAVSGVVHPSDVHILHARLASTQVDSVEWQLDVGGELENVVSGGDWIKFATPGQQLKWQATLHYTDPGNYPSCSYMMIEWLTETPAVYSITDIPNDQGRQVSVSWAASGYDYVGSPTPITEYAVYRKIDPDLSADAHAPAGKEPPGPRAYPPGDWHFLMTVPARAEEEYAVVVPTLADSTIVEGMYYSTFFVSAFTAAPGYYFDSEPDSGYSVDNLAPGVPTTFAVVYNSTAGGTNLSWDECPDGDFQYFSVYRSTDPAFLPTLTELVHMTTSTNWTDTSPEGWRYYYGVTSVDFSGNESDRAEAGSVIGAGDPPLPETFALHQNTPNPFNPATVIHYDVPAGGGKVTLRVYDVGGRLVRTLIDGAQLAGRKAVTWQGRDDRGRHVASGVYFYRMTALDYEQTRKMVLMK